MYTCVGEAQVKQREEITNIERETERKTVYIIKKKIKIGQCAKSFKIEA